jgi:hypothetical protein
VNEKRNDWDEHLHTIFFDYKTIFKLTIGHTMFRLVYELHSLMPIEYLLLSKNTPTDHIPVRHVLSSQIVDLERLEENCQAAAKTTTK